MGVEQQATEQLSAHCVTYSVVGGLILCMENSLHGERSSRPVGVEQQVAVSVQCVSYSVVGVLILCMESGLAGQ